MAAESIKECFCLFYKTVIAFIRTFTECPREKNEWSYALNFENLFYVTESMGCWIKIIL